MKSQGLRQVAAFRTSTVFGILFSIVLHALVIWNLWEPGKTLPVPHSVEIELIEPPAQIVKAESSQPGRVGGRKQIGSRRSLFPSSSPFGTPQAQVQPRTFGQDDLTDNQIYNEAMTDLFGDNSEWPFLKYMHQKIDEQFSFDRILAEWNHFGSVYVEFWVDERGLLVKNKLRVVADDPILKVHSLRTLKRSLAEPFADTKRNPSKKEIKVSVRFDYKYGQTIAEKQRTFSKRYLVFQRWTTVKRIPTEIMQQFAEGGFQMDLVKVYDTWKKFDEKKRHLYTGFDPFEDYRKDPDFNL